jgi:hypothetical protein
MLALGVAIEATVVAALNDFCDLLEERTLPQSQLDLHEVHGANVAAPAVGYLAEREGVTIDEALFAAGSLAALGGPEHDAALASLRAVTREARRTAG